MSVMDPAAFTVPKPEDRGEWLAARHGFFNASDAGCLYDCHPFRTLADVAVDKLADGPTDGGQNEAMERGQRLEPVLLAKWADDHGVDVETPSVLYVCGRVMATLDGVVIGSDTDAVEAKTTSGFWDDLPPHVRCQAVAQTVANPLLERVHVVVFDGRLRFRYFTVEPTVAEREDLASRAGLFMSFIDMGMVPEGVELGYEHVKAIHPADTGEVREVGTDEVGLLRAWADARQRRLDAEKEEAGLRDEVAALFADAAVLRHEGADLASFKAGKPAPYFDRAALAVDHPEVIDAYTRERPGTRTLRPLKGLA